MSANGNGSPRVGGINQLTTGQAVQMFADVNVTPFFPPVQRGNNDKAGHRVDWDFVVDHRSFSNDHDNNATTATVGFGLEGAASGPDNHEGTDFLRWDVAVPTAASPQAGKTKTGLGTFGALPDFAGPDFRLVDVVSIVARYSDADITAAGAASAKDRALDYSLSFLTAGGSVPGIPVVTFSPGWTNDATADNFLTRWVSPVPATGVAITGLTIAGHDGTTQIDAVIAGNIEHSSTGPKDGYISGIAGDPKDDFFVDVKTEPLSDGDTFSTTWAMHVRDPEVNYAGFLFDIIYDGSELSSLSLMPAGIHVGIEIPGGNAGGPIGMMLPGIILEGSQAATTVEGPIAVWIDPMAAMDSGISLAASDLIDLVKVSGVVKNTTPANNSDIDIDIIARRIKHVPGDPLEDPPVPVLLMASDFLYITPGVSTSFGHPRAETGPGWGFWAHVGTTATFFLPPSAFYATSRSLVNMAGLGIEHVPEPAGITIMLIGVGFLAVGWGRRRRVTT